MTAERAIAAKRALETHRCVSDVSHLPPSCGATDAHTLDMIVVADSDGLPASVLRSLSRNDCSLLEARDRAGGREWFALVRV